MAVAGVLPSATEEQILWEMPLARALQYEVLYYRLHLGRDCTRPRCSEDDLDDVMREVDAIRGKQDE